jgi:hypothetical protein
VPLEIPFKHPRRLLFGSRHEMPLADGAGKRSTAKRSGMDLPGIRSGGLAPAVVRYDGWTHSQWAIEHADVLLKMTLRFPDREETYAAGDAFYNPPGHVPIKHEPGTEIVQFSPTAELRETEAAMQRNMKSMQGG